MNKFIALWIVLVLTCAVSCSQVKKIPEADCLSKSNKNTSIIWGYYKKKVRLMFGHKLKASGEVFAFDIIKQKDSLVSLTSKRNMCDLVKSIQDEFIKTQSLNVPADSVIFIELVNPNTNVRLKAAWNPRLPSIGSKGFRAIWKRLDSTLLAGIEG